MKASCDLATHVARRRAELQRGVDRLVAIARELPDIRALYVFGSFARDQVRRRSDLDVLVAYNRDGSMSRTSSVAAKPAFVSSSSIVTGARARYANLAPLPHAMRRPRPDGQTA